jgi:uncharacterized membrane protein YedE/YeeE
MIAAVIPLISGTLFGVGLAVSGMINPAKVLGFLDLIGDWDPTLAFVMGGAMAVMAPAWLIVRILRKPLAAEAFEIPTRRDIDVRLVGGAAVFGVGWGLVGLCPGPAIAALSIGGSPVLIFVAAMLAGMMVFGLTAGRPVQPSPAKSN